MVMFAATSDRTQPIWPFPAPATGPWRSFSVIIWIFKSSFSDQYICGQFAIWHEISLQVDLLKRVLG